MAGAPRKTVRAPRGGRGRNVRVGGPRAPPGPRARRRLRAAASQQPRGRRLPRGRARTARRVFTCDGPGPAVELHRVVERRGHRAQDAARLRVQESHRGGQREPAAGGERGDPEGGRTSTAAAEAASGSRGPL